MDIHGTIFLDTHNQITIADRLSGNVGDWSQGSSLHEDYGAQMKYILLPRHTDTA
jgi:hypothetical protein